MSRSVYDDKKWRALRAAIRKAGAPCARCGSKKRIELHHVKSLANGGDPFDSDNLLPLCNKCHRQEHSKATPTAKR